MQIKFGFSLETELKIFNSTAIVSLLISSILANFIEVYLVYCGIGFYADSHCVIDHRFSAAFWLRLTELIYLDKPNHFPLIPCDRGIKKEKLSGDITKFSIRILNG